MKKDSQFQADEIMNEDLPESNQIFQTIVDDEGKSHFKENEFYFIQLPQFLNMVLTDKRSEQNSLRKIPNGTIGKLRLHKSGKITMKLVPQNVGPKEEGYELPGGSSKEVVYNINNGVKQTFYNEMAHISNESITFLPKITNKVVVSPDILSML